MYFWQEYSGSDPVFSLHLVPWYMIFIFPLLVILILITWLSVRLYHYKVFPFIIEFVVRRYFEAMQHPVPHPAFNLFTYMLLSLRTDSLLFYSLDHNQLFLFWCSSWHWFNQLEPCQADIYVLLTCSHHYECF